tara:strand:- start:9343 stop:9765 length:423 start_codon:yes stop_codon:yes gene_type:complete
MTDTEVLTERSYTLTGIADAHGIDWSSWSETVEDFSDLEDHDKQDMFLYSVRANANRHRHASFFRVNNIPEHEKKVLDTLLEDNKPQIALVYLKGVASDCGGVQILKEHAKSWDMIPNPSLDPYWGGDEEELISTKLITG